MEEVETNKGKLNQMSGGLGNITSKMGGSMVVSPLVLLVTLARVLRCGWSRGRFKPRGVIRRSG
jgi:hypothetical protein